MASGSIRWTLTRVGDDVEVRGRVRLALVVTSPEWARGMASLIKASDEYRDGGLLVTNVGPGSAAATAGIERGDVLLRHDGVPLEDAQRLRLLESSAAQSETPRQVALDAVRGAREITFSVPAGRLGITVSPFLHRMGASRPAVTPSIRERTPAASADEGKPILVHVPTALVPQVALVADSLQRSSNAKQRKKAKALLLTAAGLG
jgi:membrane-associated protease RseP (regulator of RpoE activity)